MSKRDKIFMAICLVIMIALVVCVYLVISAEKPVDCDKFNDIGKGTEYVPVPKKCMKGEK